MSSVPIVRGGVDTTVNPEWAMEHADIICVGEGEYAALELTEALEGKRDLYSIQNLWVRRDGEIIKNPIRPLIQDLDSLPFPNFDDQSIWHIHENQIYQGIMADDTPLKNWFIQMTSRGAPTAARSAFIPPDTKCQRKRQISAPPFGRECDCGTGRL